MGSMETDRELGNLNGCHHHGEGLEQQLGKEHENKISNVDYAVDIDVESANGEFDQEQTIEGDAGMKPQTQSKQYRLRRAVSDVRFKAHLARVLPDRKEYSKWGTIVMAYQTLGIVFGGLGTSPLYVWPTIQLSNPQEKDFLGVLSIMFWTFSLVALLKYGFIVLNADDHGEGGTFALYSLLCQHANIGQRPADASYYVHQENQTTRSERHGVANRIRAFLENRKGAQTFLFVVVMMGTCLVIGDGVLTPAISVLSAIAGIQSADPAIQSSVVTWVSAAILVLLFLLQPFGTHRIGFLFSPIMLAWFVTTPIVGVYNILKYYPGVFKAVSPHYIVEYFIQNQKEGWVALGGAVLCITGAEAAFADLGHFNKRAIQIAFSTVVYPSAILTYAGQTAYLIKHPGDHANAFFKSIPKPVFWPMFVVATLAAIVASQSLITATFSIVKQSMALGCFPRVKMVHTSPDKEGQVYSPDVNYGLMVLCLAVVLGFQDATQIGNAFGVAVVGVMFITTTLVTIVMLLVWKTRWPLVLLFLSVYGLVEGVYFTSVLNKVPQGGWVPFAIGTFFLIISLCWNYGRQKKYAYEMNHKISLDGLGALLSSTGTVRVPGVCFFYSDLVYGVPPIVTHYVKNVRTFHQVLVFTTIRFIPVRTVVPEERFRVGRVGFQGVYRCVARYGYQDVIDCKDEFKNQAIQSLKIYLETEDKKELSNETEVRTPSFQRSMDAYNIEDLVELENAMGYDALYVVGKVTVRTSSSNTSWVGCFVINKIYALLKVMCRSAIKELHIPPANYLEVGMLYEI